MQVEAELTELDPEERSDYLQSLGVSEGGLGSLVRATYNLLGLRTYFTSGEKVGNLLTVNPNCFIPSYIDLNNKRRLYLDHLYFNSSKPHILGLFCYFLLFTTAVFLQLLSSVVHVGPSTANDPVLTNLVCCLYLIPL